MSGTLKATNIQDGASATVNLALDSSGNVTVGNNLTVSGTTTHTGAVTNTGNMTVGGTLGVTGNSTFTGTITGSSTIAAATGTLYPLVSGTAQASTSGTSITFTGIPSWVKRITVMFNGVGTNGGSGLQVQLGSGTLTTTGYNSGSARFGASALGSANSTSGFLINVVNASTPVYGNMIITNISGNIWAASFAVGVNTNGNYAVTGGGQVSLSSALDRVACVTVNGTDVFNSGSINILYE